MARLSNERLGNGRPLMSSHHKEAAVVTLSLGSSFGTIGEAFYVTEPISQGSRSTAPVRCDGANGNLIVRHGMLVDMGSETYEKSASAMVQNEGSERVMRAESS